MKNYYYLLSGNIDPAKDTDKIHLDMLSATGKEKPHVLIFTTASTETDWHENYKKNLAEIFNKYNCSYRIIDNPEDNFIEELKNTDIIYFMGGSPYKHTRLTKYRELFKQVPIKAGTSAGAIYLGYETFFAQKDDYLLAIPNMLNFVDLHILPHSETHKEDLVFNYLANEVFISVARLYNQVGIKIEVENGIEKVFSLMGTSEGMLEKIELVLKDRTYFRTEEDKQLAIKINLIK